MKLELLLIKKLLEESPQPRDRDVKFVNPVPEIVFGSDRCTRKLGWCQSIAAVSMTLRTECTTTHHVGIRGEEEVGRLWRQWLLGQQDL